MPELRINEQTASWLELSFYDKDGDPVIPVSLSYRIDCLTTGAEIVDDTGVSPAAEVEIKLSSTVNSIQDQTNAYERRRITITATHGANDFDITKYVYRIVNFGAVT